MLVSTDLVSPLANPDALKLLLKINCVAPSYVVVNESAVTVAFALLIVAKIYGCVTLTV